MHSTHNKNMFIGKYLSIVWSPLLALQLKTHKDKIIKPDWRRGINFKQLTAVHKLHSSPYNSNVFVLMIFFNMLPASARFSLARWLLRHSPCIHSCFSAAVVSACIVIFLMIVLVVANITSFGACLLPQHRRSLSIFSYQSPLVWSPFLTAAWSHHTFAFKCLHLYVYKWLPHINKTNIFCFIVAHFFGTCHILATTAARRFATYLFRLQSKINENSVANDVLKS